jgi:Raf kinase inhibitor-like YbhB/YbcL family protein
MLSCMMQEADMRHARIVVAGLFAIGLSAMTISAQGMKITSTAFGPNGSIPSKYTCDGAGMNPPLAFSGVPAAAKSLALVVEDPDVPKNLKADGLFEHWLIWDIDPKSKGFAEGEGKGGINEMGTAGFIGPCPPDREHRYFFKLYALNAKLTGAKISSKADLDKAMAGHIVAQAELVGLYKRQ